MFLVKQKKEEDEVHPRCFSSGGSWLIVPVVGGVDRPPVGYSRSYMLSSSVLVFSLVYCYTVSSMYWVYFCYSVVSSGPIRRSISRSIRTPFIICYR